MPFRCRDCRGRFLVRSGTVMECSNLGYQTGVFAIASHRLCEAMAGEDFLFSGPVEADETYAGGLEKNKHRHKRMKAAGGPSGKAIGGSVGRWLILRS